MAGALVRSTLVALLFFFSYCAPSRYVKPLAKGERAATFSFGGPLIKFSGAVIPVPFTTLGYGYGITEKITGYGNLHTTSLLFGNIQADLGATLGIVIPEKKYGFSFSPSLQIAYHLKDKESFRLWPCADLNAYMNLGDKPSYVYGGTNMWFELSKNKAHDEPVSRSLIPNIHLGFVKVKPKWQHQVEIKYLGLGIANTPGVVEYVGLSGAGSFGAYYSITRKF